MRTVGLLIASRCAAGRAGRLPTRLGYGRFTAYQLKILQEVIILVVFVTFSAMWLGESPRWNRLVAFALILAAVGFAFLRRTAPKRSEMLGASQKATRGSLRRARKPMIG